MEEQIGLWWHRQITRMGQRSYPDAAVPLTKIRTRALCMFRAMGGAGSIQIAESEPGPYTGLRHWGQRLGGQGRRISLARLGQQYFGLPGSIAIYPDLEDNQRLVDWWAALAAQVSIRKGTWQERQRQATLAILAQYPGLAEHYRHLCHAERLRRPEPSALPPERARQEQQLRRLLAHPERPAEFPLQMELLEPVVLWLLPGLKGKCVQSSESSEVSSPKSGRHHSQQDDRVRHFDYEEDPGDKQGLLIFRPESIFSWSEYSPGQHQEAPNDHEDPGEAMDDLDRLTLSRQSVSMKRVLDLHVHQSEQQVPARSGTHEADEWNYVAKELQRGCCRVIQKTVEACEQHPVHPLPAAIQRQLDRQWQNWDLQPRRQRHQEDGELDLSAYIDQKSDRQPQQRVFQRNHRHQRDMASLLLVDASLSTESTLRSGRSIAEVMSDALRMLAYTLKKQNDPWAIYSFHSHGRTLNIQEHKCFAEPLAQDNRLYWQPQGYTRMGPAIRHAVSLLDRQPQSQRLLLLLSDGKPNDRDYYEGRYGLEDCRHAVLQARRTGTHIFCVTLDKEGGPYLPYLFGAAGYSLMQRCEDLPLALPRIYARLRESWQ